MGLYLGQEVKHKDLYNGKEVYKIVGLREKEVELEGDYSGGTHNTLQTSWLPKKGLMYKKLLGSLDRP